VRDIGGNPISLIYMLAVLALLASRGRLEKVLLRQARHGQARDSFKPTSVAALVTIALSSAWPLLIAFVGWRLTHAQQSVLAVAIGHGLVAVGCMLWPVMFLRRASMKGGLGEAHFAWPVESMQALHSGVGRFAVILAPLVLAAAIMQAQPSRAYADSLGRLLTMLSLLVFSGAMASLLQPTGKTLGPALARHPHGWLWRTRHTWYAVACIVPVVLAIAAGMGYHYTTLHLSYRILLTLLLIVGLCSCTACSCGGSRSPAPALRQGRRAWRVKRLKSEAPPRISPKYSPKPSRQSISTRSASRRGRS